MAIKIPPYFSSKKFLVHLSILVILLDVAGFWRYLFLPHLQANEVMEMRTIDPYYNHGLRENASGIVSYGSFNPIYYTNSLGLRDKSIRTVSENTGTKHRILFLGDSFAEGIGLPYDSTFIGYLSQKDTSLEVLNAGVASYGVRTYLLKLNYLISYQHLQVKDVYCMVDFSDPPDGILYEDFKPQIKRPWINEKLYQFTIYLRSHSLLSIPIFEMYVRCWLKKYNLRDQDRMAFIVASSNHFDQVTGHRYKDLRYYWPYLSVLKDARGLDGDSLVSLIPIRNEMLDLFRSDLDTLAMFCNNRGLRLTYVVYAQSYQLLQGSSFQECNLKNYVNIVSEVATKNNLGFIDLYKAFVTPDPVTNHFTYATEFLNANGEKDNHWNALGHQRVADSLYSYIKTHQ